MDVDITTVADIQKPLNEVAEFAADPDNVPLWYVNIQSVEWQTPRPLRLGSRISFVAKFLGRRMVYTYEVVEFTPHERLLMRTSEGPFPMETTYTWEETANGGTRMRLRNRGRPTGFSKWLAPFMSVAMRHANRKDLETLKRRLESGS